MHGPIDSDRSHYAQSHCVQMKAAPILLYWAREEIRERGRYNGKGAGTMNLSKLLLAPFADGIVLSNIVPR